MDRRTYLAGVTGAVSLLAGCSAGGTDDDAATATVTPAPVPDSPGANDPIVEDGAVNPRSVGVAHVDALAGSNSRLAIEYAARTDAGDPIEIVRVVATTDGSAGTYRRYVLRPLDLGGSYQLFRGYWYDDGEAVARLIEAGNRSVYREPDDFTPPPAPERLERDALVDTLAAFQPTASRETDGYRLAADEVADPDRLPTGRTIDAGRDGGLEARLESTGLVSALDAWVAATLDSDPVMASFRLAVTGRGTTSVERPTAARTFEWYQALRDESPVPTPSGDAVGMGDPPGRSGP